MDKCHDTIHMDKWHNSDYMDKPKDKSVVGKG
jgi:hypothetical protein